MCSLEGASRSRFRLVVLCVGRDICHSWTHRYGQSLCGSSHPMISYALDLTPFVDHICPGAIRKGRLSRGRGGSSGRMSAWTEWCRCVRCQRSSTKPFARLCALMMSP